MSLRAVVVRDKRFVGVLVQEVMADGSRRTVSTLECRDYRALPCRDCVMVSLYGPRDAYIGEVSVDEAVVCDGDTEVLLPLGTAQEARNPFRNPFGYP